MAYNVLKGKVDGAVDQHADQEIDGVKVFKSTISASVFWDTDAQSPCATIKDVAVKNIKDGNIGGIMVWDGNGEAITSRKLKFNGDTLATHNLIANTINGSGAGIIDLPTDKFNGTIDATHLNFGAGLRDVRGELQVKTGAGLQIENNSVSLSFQPNGGLVARNGKIQLQPSSIPPVNTKGQNLGDNDVLIVGDVSREETRSTTLKNIYDNYFRLKVPQAHGSKNQIQFKGSSGFASSANLIFDESLKTLEINGKLKSHEVVSALSLRCNGAVYNNITRISQKEYSVEEEDYTIVCNTSNNSITINLPSPCNNEGRVLIIKKVDDNKHKINSNLLKLSCEDGRIDIGNELSIKMNYSTRTLQCDGENWWIISSKGS